MDQQEDAYAGFAERYDRFHEQIDAYDPAEVSFFQQLFAQQGVRSVLDCACGTGRHLPLFHSLGCEVVGSDLSPSMLAIARRNLAALDLQIPLHCVDYCDLPRQFSRRFDAVACLSSSILHMPSERKVLKAFNSMAGVLSEKGLLILTQGTSDKQWKERPRFILAVNRQDFSRVFAIDYVGAGARYHVLDISQRKQSQGLDVWTVDYPRIYLRDDYERFLKASGFDDIEFYGTYGFDAYDRDASERLIVVAQL